MTGPVCGRHAGTGECGKLAEALAQSDPGHRTLLTQPLREAGWLRRRVHTTGTGSPGTSQAPGDSGGWDRTERAIDWDITTTGHRKGPCAHTRPSLSRSRRRSFVGNSAVVAPPDRLNRPHGEPPADPDRHRHRWHVHRRGRLRRGLRRAGHHQDPVDPGQPGRRVPRRHRQGARRCSAPSGDATSTAVSHGTTVATNQLLEGKVEALGFITTEGYEAMLEIARQSVPDGYGNSYFWVKPDRDRARATWSRGVGGRLDFTGAEVRPFDEDGARAAARWFRDAGHRHARRLLPALLRQPGARGADARGPARGAPRRRGVDLAARCCASTASTSAR